MKTTTIFSIILLLLVLLSHSAFSQLTQITSSSANEYHPKWKPDETRIAFTKNTGDINNPEKIGVFLMDANGENIEEIPLNASGDHGFNWSPNGQKIVFDAYPQNNPPCNIYVYDMQTSSIEELTSSELGENHPAFSPDGSKIAYASFGNIWVMSANGDNKLQLTSGSEDWHPDWYPSGDSLIFTSTRNGNQDLWVIAANGGTPRAITNGPANEDRAIFSPDGSKLVYTSDKNGNDDIFVMTMKTKEITQITHHSSFDSHPHWSPDGSKIAFASLRNGNFDIFVKDVSYIGINEALENNHNLKASPNPCNSIIELSYTLDKSEKIQLNIYHSNGQLIKNIMNENAVANDYKIMLNTEDLPSGLLMILLNSNGKNQTIKVIKENN